MDNGGPGRLARGSEDSVMAREMVEDRRCFPSVGPRDRGRGGVMTTDDQPPGALSPGNPNSTNYSRVTVSMWQRWPRRFLEGCGR